MIKAEYTMKLGTEEIKISVEVDTHADFIDKLQFFTTIPKEGPNGEKDLRLCHRVAANKFHYYSVICDSAKLEYKFGQSLENKGALFCKGVWETLFLGADQEQTQPTQETVKPAVAPVTPAAKIVVTPVTPKVVVTAKPVVANVNLNKPTTPIQGTTTTIKPITPVQTVTKVTTTPAATPATPKSNAAAAILAKMNITKTT